MMDVWGVDDFVSNFTSRSIKQEELKQAMMEAMKHKMEHELTFKTRERVTKFIRSTQQSEIIGHNYMIMRSLKMAVENGK